MLVYTFLLIDFALITLSFVGFNSSMLSLFRKIMENSQLLAISRKTPLPMVDSGYKCFTPLSQATITRRPTSYKRLILDIESLF